MPGSDPCEICDEPLDEEDAVYAGGVLRVHPECQPQRNVPLEEDSPFNEPDRGGPREI